MEELLFEFRAQRDVLLRHFEAIDSKAGILLGFAAAIATLGPAQGPLAPAGRATAIASAISALAAFVPRRFPSFSPQRLAGSLVDRTPDRRAHLLAYLHLRNLTAADATLRSKSRTLVVAFSLTLTATVLLAADIILSGGRT